MEKLLFLIIVLSFFSNRALKAQDTIVRKNGAIIYCKVIDEDNDYIYYVTIVKNKIHENRIKRAQTKQIGYLKDTDAENRERLILKSLNDSYYLHGNNILLKEDAEKKLLAVPEAYRIFRLGMTYKGLGRIFAFSGGFLCGYASGGIIFKNQKFIEVKDTLFAGIGIIVIALIFEAVSNVKKENAFIIYNNAYLDGISKVQRVALELKFTGSGLQLNF